jgi:hypothetical protein
MPEMFDIATPANESDLRLRSVEGRLAALDEIAAKHQSGAPEKDTIAALIAVIRAQVAIDVVAGLKPPR